MNQLVFYRNWWELAKLQTDNANRLAFYDAIFDYSFGGEVPKDVGHDGGKAARAARFAFLTVQPIIDLSAKRASAGAASGEARRSQANTETNKPTNTKTNKPTNTKTNKPTNTKTNKPTNTKTNKPTNTVLNNRIELNRIEENRSVDASASTTGGGGGRLPSREVFISTCESALGVPRDFADVVYAELSMFDGEDAAGVKVGSWRRYVKAAWNRAQTARASASAPSDDAPRRITEEDL